MFFAKVSRQAIQRRMPKRLLGASHGQAWAKSKSLGKKRLSGKAKQNEGGKQMSQNLSNDQKLLDEIKYLSKMTGDLNRKLQTYEYVFSLIDDIRIKPPETITCKYRLLNGSDRKRRKGVKCPPNCQVIIGHANTQWGKGCQIAHIMKEKREQTNE